MAIRNLYDSPKPIKALVDDTNRVILSEFELKDYVLIEDGGTSATTAKGARDNLQTIRFIDYSDPTKNGLMPLKAPEKNMVAKNESGKMFYSNNNNDWVPFGRISISSEIGGVYNTLADVTNFIFTDGFALELDGTSVRVKLDIVQKLEELEDVDLGVKDEIQEGSALVWNVDLQKFVPLFQDIDGKIARATENFAVNFVDLDDIDLESMMFFSRLNIPSIVYYDYNDKKIKFKKLLYKFSDLTDVIIDDSITDEFSEIVYDINNKIVQTKKFSAGLPFMKADGTLTEIPIIRHYWGIRNDLYKNDYRNSTIKRL